MIAPRIEARKENKRLIKGTLVQHEESMIEKKIV